MNGEMSPSFTALATVTGLVRKSQAVASASTAPSTAIAPKTPRPRRPMFIDGDGDLIKVRPAHRSEQGASEKAGEDPAVDEFERRLPGAVVAAAQHRELVRDGALLKLAHEI